MPGDHQHEPRDTRDDTRGGADGATGGGALPVVGVSMGDPGGIGPEVVVRGLADPAVRRSARWVVYGSRAAMLAAGEALGVDPFWWAVSREAALAPTALSHDVLLIDRDEETGPETGRWRPEPTRDGGLASFSYVEDALADAAVGLRERASSEAPAVGHLAEFGAGVGLDAVVTAPISKEAWALAGKKKWPGHTELVASRLDAPRARMMFVSPHLWVMLATTHIPLMRVSDELSLGRVLETIELCHDACVALGVRRPRIAVCGLNPHAGERGLLGADESRVIEPAVAHAQRQGIQASGPHPGDTVFNAALRTHGAPRPASGRRFDAVVAMYHDQGLIPVKLLGFDKAVNLTAGLPLPRTSPDHGTAFDIAGTGVADAGSMTAAMTLAVRLARPGVLKPAGSRADTDHADAHDD